MRYIADTTVISNLAGIGRLDLLRSLFGTLHISTDVLTELRAGLAAGYRFYEGLDNFVYPPAADGWLLLEALSGDDEFATFIALLQELDAGEASSLSIARSRGWTLLTDDRDARRAATLRGVVLSGTIGCLVLSVRRGLHDRRSANALLREMIDRGYRSPLVDIEQLLTS